MGRAAYLTSREHNGRDLPPEGGLCEDAGELEDEENPWIVTGVKVRTNASQRFDHLCFGCPVIVECRAWAAHFPWSSVVIGGWAAPGHGAFPPWSDGEDYPMPEPPLNKYEEAAEREAYNKSLKQKVTA